MISYMLSKIAKIKERTINMPNGEIPYNRGTLIKKETITIDIELYKTLLNDSEILNALKAGGVEDWEWYSDSMKEIWDNGR